MIESIMYMGIGFLFAALIAVAVVPLVHGRAVRLTARQLEATLPHSFAEIQADKDLLRAEFAMSTRRLEMTIEQLKHRTTSQLVELGKNADVINRLRIERGTLKASVIALRSQVEALKRRPAAAQKRVSAEGQVVSVMREWIPHRIHQ
jgi:type IV secretory pathway VirB4 component